MRCFKNIDTTESQMIFSRTIATITFRNTRREPMLMVEEYISIFEDMGNFLKDGLITAKMAYDRFSYDIEKAWCNATVQETMLKERAKDKSKTAQSDPLYGNF